MYKFFIKNQNEKKDNQFKIKRIFIKTKILEKMNKMINFRTYNN